VRAIPPEHLLGRAMGVRGGRALAARAGDDAVRLACGSSIQPRAFSIYVLTYPAEAK
jgi:hypothetical protein